MNGAACVEEECCEFVETDPTGRYGRVYIYIYAFPLLINFCWFFMFQFIVLIPGFEFHVWQYNEILGKGASKTVYA